jgi:hypothetical protein
VLCSFIACSVGRARRRENTYMVRLYALRRHINSAVEARFPGQESLVSLESCPP